jgi:DNA-binding transcriptional LysR family regulator
MEDKAPRGKFSPTAEYYFQHYQEALKRIEELEAEVARLEKQLIIGGK